MKNSQKTQKRYAARIQNAETAKRKRNRQGRAENDPSAFTRAQAIRRVGELTDPELVERFTHHQNKHVKARAESKLRAIETEARILPFAELTTIKAVREKLVGVTDKAIRALGNARIEEIRERNAAKKSRKAA